jgi:3-oxoacyl-[acyl-carrier-protein] synthase II
MRRVFVTGLGAITAVGNSVPEFWKAVVSGISGVGKITRFDATEFSVKIAAEVKGFDGARFFSPKEIRRKDLFIQFAVGAAEEAIKDAGLDFEKENSSRMGAIVGSGIGGIATWDREFKVLQRSPRRVSPFFIPMMIVNSAPAEISIRYKLKGPNFGTVSACATAAHAIGEAYKCIKHGDADVMITGGSEAAVSPIAIAGFGNMRALSTRNDDPEKASRPFDAERDGFVVGEGAGIIVLEEEEHARNRGVTPYCEIMGYGTTCDAYHITAPDPSAEQAARAMTLALEEREIAPEEVDYINAHGTSTPLNDKIETLAIKRVFGDYAYRVPISSTKSTVGHLLGAAGAVEIVVSALSMRDGIIHPTMNLDHPDPECDLDYTPEEAKKAEVRTVISNSFGFGGHNTAIVVRKIED